MKKNREHITPQQIYQMALNGEEKALKTEIANGSINVDELYTPKPGMLFPPLVFLAMQKQHAAVDILLRCGAHVRHAVFGAAFVGDQIALNRYLQMPGGTKQRAAEGAAFGGQFALLSRIESENWKQLDKSRIAFYLASKDYRNDLWRYFEAGASVQDAADGAALAGEFDLLKILQDKDEINKEYLLFFLAQGGYREAALSLIQSGVSPQQATNGAALAGRYDLLNELKQRYSSSLDQSSLIYWLAFGGHQAAVLEQVKTQADRESAADGAIRNHHMTLLTQLSRCDRLDRACVIEKQKEAGHPEAAVEYARQIEGSTTCRFFDTEPPEAGTEKKLRSLTVAAQN